MQDPVAGTDPDMRAERLAAAAEEDEIERLPRTHDKCVLAVAPKFARAKIRNGPAEMAKHGVGKSLTVCAVCNV
jgi:hypothetical protein